VGCHERTHLPDPSIHRRSPAAPVACFGPGGTRTASGDGGIARYARHRGPKQCGKPASTTSLTNPGCTSPAAARLLTSECRRRERGETTGLAEVDVLRPCSSGGSNQPRRARVPREGSPAPVNPRRSAAKWTSFHSL
jgi:hypothetical protein